MPMQNLERHFSVETRVPRAIHVAECASTHTFDEPKGSPVLFETRRLALVGFGGRAINSSVSRVRRDSFVSRERGPLRACDLRNEPKPFENLLIFDVVEILRGGAPVHLRAVGNRC